MKPKDRDGPGLQASLEGLDLNLLLTLDVLLEIRNVTATAERVGVTQSAVSHRLARIREFFDDPLLVSAGDDLVLTPKAEALQTPLRVALRGLRDALLFDEELDPATAERTFVIAAADLAEISLLPTLLAHLTRVAPGMRIRMKGRGSVTGEALAEGKADFAIAPGEGSIPGVGLEDTRGIRQRMLFSEGFSVVARRDHPRLRGRLTLKRYLSESHVLVAPQGTPGGLVDAVLAKQGARRRIAAQVASFLSAPFLVAGTDHLLTCPTSLATATAKPLRLRVLKPPIELPQTKLFLFWHDRMDRDPAHRWFRENLIELVAQSG
jgi:DNA-binding transcriptional LysR family regulator